MDDFIVIIIRTKPPRDRDIDEDDEELERLQVREDPPGDDIKSEGELCHLQVNDPVDLKDWIQSLVVGGYSFRELDALLMGWSRSYAGLPFQLRASRIMQGIEDRFCARESSLLSMREVIRLRRLRRKIIKAIRKNPKDKLI